jgi:hypothetical protein
MAKGSKKYASHEYDMVKGGPSLQAHKLKAHELRRGSKTYPQKMSDGGTVGLESGGAPRQSPNVSKPPTTPSSSNLATTASNFFASMAAGKAKGGEVKKHDAKNLKQLDSSMRKFFKEEAQEKTKGGKIEAKNKEEKATHKGDSKKDDKVPILATEGEAVLPKSLMKSKNAPKKAEKFVKKIKKEE